MNACQIHKYHSPLPMQQNVHHILPLSWRGPDVASNKVTVCPSGHRNIHVLLDYYVHAQGLPPWTKREHFGVTERALAQRAWDEHTGPTPYTAEEVGA